MSGGSWMARGLDGGHEWDNGQELDSGQELGDGQELHRIVDCGSARCATTTMVGRSWIAGGSWRTFELGRPRRAIKLLVVNMLHNENLLPISNSSPVVRVIQTQIMVTMANGSFSQTLLLHPPNGPAQVNTACPKPSPSISCQQEENLNCLLFSLQASINIPDISLSHQCAGSVTG